MQQLDESKTQSHISNTAEQNMNRISHHQSKTDKLLQNSQEIDKTQTHNLFLQTDIEYSKSEVISKISKIFLIDAKFSSNDNDFFLSQQAVNSILSKSGIINKNIIQLPDIDVLFKLVTNGKTKINLKEFIDFFIKLTQRIYPDDFKANSKATTNYFFNCFFGTYNKVLEEKINLNFMNNTLTNTCTINSIESVITAKIDEKTIYVLNSLYQPIRGLYKVYFSNEVGKGVTNDSEAIQLQSLKGLITLCKDFELFPYLLNETQLVTYFNFILKFSLENPGMNTFIIPEGKDIGRCYRLSLFYLFFFHFASVFYYKHLQMNFPEKKEPNINILFFFLEKLENSLGISRFAERKYRTNSLKFSLIPKQAVLEYIKEMKDDQQQLQQGEDINVNMRMSQQTQQTPTKNEGSKVNTSPSNNKAQAQALTQAQAQGQGHETSTHTIMETKSQIDLKRVLTISNEVIQLIEDNHDILCEAFLTYSRINDKISFSKMSLSSYIKFLKDADIISSIPPEQRELYSTLGKDLQKKTLNICSIKKFNSKENRSISVAAPELTDEQRLYKHHIAELLSSNKPLTDNNKLSEGEANVIFKSIISNTECKMDFSLFIRSFELIAVKMFPEQKSLSDSYEKLLRINILPKVQQSKVSQHSSEMKEALCKINNEKMKDFLILFSSVLEPVYKHYADLKERMTFGNYFAFYKAFSLFPDMIKLNKLKYIFFTLSDSNVKDADMKHEHINYSLFLESLALTAMFFTFKNNNGKMMTDMDKMLYLVERIYQSTGALAFVQIHKPIMDFLIKMKKEYPLSSTYQYQAQMTKMQNSARLENVYEEDNL